MNPWDIGARGRANGPSADCSAGPHGHGQEADTETRKTSKNHNSLVGSDWTMSVSLLGGTSFWALLKQTDMENNILSFFWGGGGEGVGRPVSVPRTPPLIEAVGGIIAASVLRGVVCCLHMGAQGQHYCVFWVFIQTGRRTQHVTHVTCSLYFPLNQPIKKKNI